MEFSDYSCRVILGFFGLKSNSLKFPFKYIAAIIRIIIIMTVM